MMKRFIAFASSVGLVLGMNILPMAASAATVPLSSLQPGDLIRGESLSAVYYYGEDGFRYVFPNDKTYFTWYENFDTVKWLTDVDLGKVQIGGNVTYRPGIKMIKINSDPKTYAVGKNGELRWVTTEAVAIALYGTNWNTKIDDVPDAYFSNYEGGADIEAAEDFVPAEETADVDDINDDKNLQPALVISITDNAYSNVALDVPAGRAVRFTNNGAMPHTATAEDLSWGTGTLQPGDSFARYFDDEGSYDYFCSYHPTMMGTLNVE